MSVGRKVRKWRVERGLTERAAAARARVSQPTWRAIEADEVKRIGLDVAQRVVAACEGAITLADFERPKPKSERGVERHAGKRGVERHAGKRAHSTN